MEEYIVNEENLHTDFCGKRSGIILQWSLALHSLDWRLSSSLNIQRKWALCVVRADLALSKSLKSFRIWSIAGITPPSTLEQCSWTSAPGRVASQHTEVSPDQWIGSNMIFMNIAYVLIQEWGEFQFTCEIWVLFLHPLHSNVLLRRFAIAIRPHRLHTWSLKVIVIFNYDVKTDQETRQKIE